MYTWLKKNDEDPDLDQDIYEQARMFLGEVDIDLLAALVAYKAKDKTVFPGSLLQLTGKTKDRRYYWLYLESSVIDQGANKICILMRGLLTCPASSAGLERLFSSFGLIHTKLRNKLGNEKVAKLLKVYTSLRDDNSINSDEDNFDIVLSKDIEILWFELRSPCSCAIDFHKYSTNQ